MRTIGKLRLDGLLSFAPDSEPFGLQGLNVLIGPNGSGKSNLIEALELLAATPHDLAGAVRDGGGPAEWLWKGPDRRAAAAIEVELEEGTPTHRPLRYRLGFTAVQSRLEVVDEAIEELEPNPGEDDVYFYYRFQQGHPVLNVKDNAGRFTQDGFSARICSRTSPCWRNGRTPSSTPRSLGPAGGSGPSARSGSGPSVATSRSGSPSRPTSLATSCCPTAETWLSC